MSSDTFLAQAFGLPNDVSRSRPHPDLSFTQEAVSHFLDLQRNKNGPKDMTCLIDIPRSLPCPEVSQRGHDTVGEKISCFSRSAKGMTKKAMDTIFSNVFFWSTCFLTHTYYASLLVSIFGIDHEMTRLGLWVTLSFVLQRWSSVGGHGRLE